MADNPTTALVPYEAFRGELLARQDEIAALLPSTITKEAFVNTAIVAVKQNPELLECDRRSLHQAVTKAAQDGMRPDGREGVILPQNEKFKVKDASGKEVEQWRRTARWQPMVFGIRKRARELDDIMMDAQVVYANDRFVRLQGDDARIEHEPAPLGQPRGNPVGVYAIFRRGTEVLHREVMDAEQIAAVRAISKQPNGLLWAKVTDEAWRKTVVRRGAKSVPCSEKLRTAIERHDEMFDLEARADQARDITPTARAALPPRKGTTVMIAWRPGDALEYVPVNEFSEKAFAFIRSEEAAVVLDWARRNTLGLREFWGYDKDAALALKAEIEKVAARQQAKEPQHEEPTIPASEGPTHDGAELPLEPAEAAAEPDDMEIVLRELIAEVSKEPDAKKRHALWHGSEKTRAAMTDTQVARLKAALDQMEMAAGKRRAKQQEAA